jgi:hypothetical protein
METISIILFVVISVGPLLAYGLYTARFGEPRRPDKPRKRKGRTASKASAA